MIEIREYSSRFHESWLRCRALSYMRSSFNDEITGEKELVTVKSGVSLVAVDGDVVVGIAESIYLDGHNGTPEMYGLPAIQN